MVADRFRLFVLASAGLALTLLLIPATAAQGPTDGAPAARDWSQDVPAHLTVVSGEVTLVRDGRLEPAEANQLILAGDRLHTQGGRAQILFNDGSTLAVDQDTLIDLLSDSLVRLIDGRLRLTIARPTGDLDYRVDHAAGFVEIQSAGEYRVQAGKDRRGKAELELIVYHGHADLANDFGRTLVRAGRHAATSADTEPSLPYTINSAVSDEFDAWVAGLRDAHLTPVASQSASYLPAEESYYANTLDTYGSWDYAEPYGAVWYPRVQVGWQPYAMGRWSYTGYYGWAWVGIDHWAWPTYHYGRWGLGGAGWYWVPNRTWGPAWVAWGGAPGYVGWCPLGYNGYPVVGWGRPTPYSAWTVLPSHAWTHNVWVNEHRVNQGAMSASARNVFRERQMGPAPVGDVPRRAIAPIGAPTRPRDVTTRARPQPVSAVVNADRGGRNTTSSTTLPAASRAQVSAPQGRDVNSSSRDPLNNRGGNASNGFPATRAVPQTSAVLPETGGSGGRAPRATMPGAVADQPSPSRAVPRQQEPPSIQQYQQYSIGADRSRPAQRAQEPVAAPPSYANRGGQSVERNPGPQPPPTRVIAPPQRGAPSSAAPPPSAPPSAPPSVAPRVRSAEPSGPSGPPPGAVSAPPSRGGGSSGGGSSGGAAVPRRGGGRGGG